ncbi:hypothetical protein KI387_022150, partial [Taxus chinensis]
TMATGDLYAQQRARWMEKLILLSIGFSAQFQRNTGTFCQAKLSYPVQGVYRLPKKEK